MSKTGRLFIKAMLTLLVLALLAPFSIIKGEDGRPLMSWKDMVGDWPPKWYRTAEKETKSMMKKAGSTLGTSDNDFALDEMQYYVWANNQGNLVFSQRPPNDGRAYQKATHSEVTLIQSMSDRDIARVLAKNSVKSNERKKPLVVGNRKDPLGIGERSSDGADGDSAYAGLGEGTEALQAHTEKVDQMMSEDGGLSSVSPGDIPALIDAAKQIQQAMDNRASDI